MVSAEWVEFHDGLPPSGRQLCWDELSTAVESLLSKRAIVEWSANSGLAGLPTRAVLAWP
jgi:hypothetical protein